MIEEDFAGRVFAFGSATAKSCAAIAAQRKATGRPIAEADCQIAAIARTHGAVVATRNIRDFGGCGIEMIDPRRAS